MEVQERVAESARSHPLLWAIVEFREAIDQLIEEQKALVLSRTVEPLAVESAPPVVPTPPPVVPSSTPPPPPVEPEPIAVSKPLPPPAPPVRAKVWTKESTAPSTPRAIALPASPAVSEPESTAISTATIPARPEDSRQRLDALAAKLLDRRLKQNPGDTSLRRDEA